MLTRNILKGVKQYKLTYIPYFIRNIQQCTTKEHVSVMRNELPDQTEKNAKREPFLKNLFLAKCDLDLLAFPEPHSTERFKFYCDWLKSVEDYITSNNDLINTETSKEELFKSLRNIGFFGTNIEKKYDGLNFSEMETARLLETVGAVPWIGSFLLKNNICASKLISKYGTEEQKANYLPKIASGELISSICITELTSGPNLKNITSTAVLSDFRDSWIINGEKIYVPNAKEANLFIVLAHCTEYEITSLNHDNLTFFIVENTAKGINYSSNIETVGQQGVQMYSVRFKDVSIPKENILSIIGNGINILRDILKPGKSNNAGLAIGILKNFIGLVTTNILERKHMDRNMYELGTVHNTIGKMVNSLYSMESMLHFTTGLADQYEDQDCIMEKAVTELYCATECVNQIYEGLKLIGLQAYLKDNPYMQAYQDALALTTFDIYVSDLKSYIGLLGLQHVGQNYSNHIRKIRNPTQFPRYILKNILFQNNDIKLNIYEYVHPSFALIADYAEKCVNLLHFTTIHILQKYGPDVLQQEFEILKLGEMTCLLYTLITVMSRSSRSYCIGLRNAQLEYYICSYFAHTVLQKMKLLKTKIEDSDSFSENKVFQEVSAAVFAKKGYCLEHPLNRTY